MVLGDMVNLHVPAEITDGMMPTILDAKGNPVPNPRYSRGVFIVGDLILREDALNWDALCLLLFRHLTLGRELKLLRIRVHRSKA